MVLLLLACHSFSGSGFLASPKADTAPADTADTAPADTADTGGDTADSTDSGDSSTGDTAGDTAGDTGRTGKSAAELAGEPGGLGCASVPMPGLGALLLGLVGLRRRRNG